MKEIFNNLPINLDPYILDWNISLYYKEKEVAVFQFIKLTEGSDGINEFYLERGKVLNPNNIEKINLADTYNIKINTPEFVGKLQEVKLKNISSGAMPGRRIFIGDILGVYNNLFIEKGKTHTAINSITYI